ncbi:unnamed protein product [Brachionus calyciflorus]|uniref:Uncharacterized protein n=1 Tax=Brachionus calyciflorus TaxID=104777 RepID=A0A814AC94_9BILA|nr:unnamed protein product [Brachionus calyciflorus]
MNPLFIHRKKTIYPSATVTTNRKAAYNLILTEIAKFYIPGAELSEFKANFTVNEKLSEECEYQDENVVDSIDTEDETWSIFGSLVDEKEQNEVVDEFECVEENENGCLENDDLVNEEEKTVSKSTDDSNELDQ